MILVTPHIEPVESRVGSVGQPQAPEIIGFRDVPILGGGASCPFVARSEKSRITVIRVFTYDFTSGPNASTRSYLTTESTKRSTEIARSVTYSREIAQRIRSGRAWSVSYRVGVSPESESKWICLHPGSAGPVGPDCATAPSRPVRHPTPPHRGVRRRSISSSSDTLLTDRSVVHFS
jgi:hypothetical protein